MYFLFCSHLTTVKLNTKILVFLKTTDLLTCELIRDLRLKKSQKINESHHESFTRLSWWHNYKNSSLEPKLFQGYHLQSVFKFSSVQFNLFATLCIYGHQQINKYFIWQKKTNKQYNIPSAHKHTAAGMATNRPLGLQVKQPPLRLSNY